MRSITSSKRKEGQRFDGDYHREMFKADMNALLKLDHNPSEVKAFLDDAFRYYTNLYIKIWKATQKQADTYPAVFFNSLNELDSQFMMVLSACRVDDPEEDEKIRIVTAELDRVFSLLQLQGAYGSNKFADRLFEISTDIRDKTASEISTVFERHLIAELVERRNQEITQPLSYSLFRMMSTDRLNTRFTRYFFGRIELLLAKGMRLNMRHDLKDLITLRGAETGFHIEHILSRNEENLALFDGDEERFDTERNRLGGVLLLKGRDNISSNNEIYSKKLNSYANTLYWNETLREDTYQSKLDFKQFTSDNNLKFRHMNQFGPNELEERHKLLFDLLPLMWPVPNCEKKSR